MRAIAGSSMITAVLLVIAGAASAAAPGAENYPARPVRMLVGIPPGGGVDTVARAVAYKLSERWGQSVIVDNRTGAGGAIAMELVAQATADGYTLLAGSTGTIATASVLKKVAFDTRKAYAPVIEMNSQPYLLAVGPSLKVNSVKELIAYAKAKPGAINYGSSGKGGIAHLAGELFDLLAATKMTHVAYKGTGPALNDLLGGQIQMIYGSAPSTIPLVRGNRLRAIAVTTTKRSAALPDIPTVAEAGVPGYEVVLWYGVLGPKGLPKTIVARWNAEIRKATKLPDMKERLISEGFDIADSPPEVFQAVVRRDVAKWVKVVKDAKVKESP